MIEINLLPNLALLSPAEHRLRGWLRVITAITTVITVVIGGGFLVYYFYLLSQTKSLEAKKSASLERLQSQVALATDLRTVKEKIAGINLIRQSQVDLASQVKSIQALLPPGAELSALSLGETGEANMTLRVADVKGLNTLLANLTAATVSGSLKDIHLSGLKVDQYNVVSLLIAAKYSPAKLYAAGSQF